MIVMRCDVERPGTLREDHQGRTPPTSCEPAQRMLPRQLVPGWRLTRGHDLRDRISEAVDCANKSLVGGYSTSAKGGSLTPTVDLVLTEVRTGGQDWWTLGFEATGPADLLRSELQATAALVFAQAPPNGVQPGPDKSSSYAQWLSLRPGDGSNANA
jgi:hypothetical protein